MKIRPVGAELFHVDGETDMTKPTVDFRNFAKAPKGKMLFNDNTAYGPTAEILHRIMITYEVHGLPKCTHFP
jgi:hypothetical protein